MRKSNQVITDQTAIEKILRNSSVCRIAIATDDVPYIVPLNYGYNQGYIYFHCAHAGRKIDLLKENPKVGFEIEYRGNLVTGEKACDWATFYQSVIGTGTITFLSDTERKKKALSTIMTHNGFREKLKFGEKHLKATLILEMHIDKICGKQSSNWDKIVEGNLYEMETERLRLLELYSEDMERIHQIHSYPEVDEFNTLGLPKNLDETKDVMKPFMDDKENVQRKLYSWKIIDKESGSFIGLAGMVLSLDKFRLGEIFYKLDPKFWGKGYATETAKELIRSGFEHFKLQKVEAGVATGNSKSVKVLEKAGMVREGLRDKILPIRGKWEDCYHYAVVAKENGF